MTEPALDQRTRVIWKVEDSRLKAYVQTGDDPNDLQPVIWAPQPGSQEAFLSSPVFETLYEGTRGPGKTDGLIMDFAQHIGQGFGPEWRGILFRQTFPQLSDLIAKTRKWYPRIFPGAKYNEQNHTWKFPEGEQLLLRYIRDEKDYEEYHGHAYPWIGFEELCTWPTKDPYIKMMSCCRSSNPDIPRKMRATANPYGRGHNWVKARFQLPVGADRIIGKIVKTPGEPDRVAIRGRLIENRVLLTADPGYISRIRASAKNEAELKAWLYGDWDIVAGGMFDDLWNADIHVVPDVPLDKIPKGWLVDRSYDHGQSAPFSVGWWAESNGEPWELPDGRVLGKVRGDIIRIAEWYGCKAKEPNVGLRMPSEEIALGIIDREHDWGLQRRVRAGPADSSIFDDFEPKKSVAGLMQNAGVRWMKADKGPGSRKQGWEVIRKLLKGSVPQGEEKIREKPGLFVCERCKHFRRTMPVLPRGDKDPDDADTQAEDHIGDETRYRVRVRRRTAVGGRWNR